MNTIYCIVWNAARGMWVVASEFARKGKKTKAKTGRGLVLASLVMMPLGAWGACVNAPTDSQYDIICSDVTYLPYSLGRRGTDTGTSDTLFLADMTKLKINSGATLIREGGPAISMYNGSYGRLADSIYQGIGKTDYSSTQEVIQQWKDRADILISADATVQNIHFNNSAGFQNAGPNTIETVNDTLIYIETGGKVVSSRSSATSGSASAEAINVMGFNNLIINYGSIYSDGTNAALWFEDKAKHLTGAGSTTLRDLPYYKRPDISPPAGFTADQVDLRNQTYNYGYLGIVNPAWLKKNSDGRIATDASGNVVIDWDNVPAGNKRIVNDKLTLTDLAGNAIDLTRNVFGSQSTTGAAGIILGNYGDIVGSLNFGEGNDTLEMFSGSKIYGNISAKGNGNYLGLRGTGKDAFSGNITGFQYLTKADTGTWEITGKIGSFKEVNVDEGKLTLTADNSDYSGIMLINANTDFSVKDKTKKAIVEAHSSSLPQNTDNATRIYNNGTLVFNQDKIVKNNVYSGVIKGEGNVVKEGAENLILTGDSTYTGGTIINAGNLQLGNGGTSGAVTGNINIFNNASSLIFNHNNTRTSDNNISGAGKVVKEGTGELTLVGNNTYEGGTTINAGTLAVNADSKLGAVTGPLTFNGGTLKFLTGFDGIKASRNITLNSKGGTIDTNGISSTISQIMHGAGGLTKAGTGTLTLTGINTYTGLTTLNGGDLVLQNKGAVAGNINLNSTASTLYFNNTGDITYDGVISGTGMLTKNGADVLKLTGNNTWTGNTLVNSGMLIVNGDQSKNDGGTTGKKMTTTVKSGATLGGQGNIGGDVVIESGAILSPGDYVNGASSAKDSLDINGSLTLRKDSVSNFQLGQKHVSGGDFNDLVNVTGDLTLGGTLNVQEPKDGSFGPGVYRLFNYGGTLYNAEGGEYNLAGENGDKTLIFGKFPNNNEAGHYLQTIVENQVNLINTNGLNLQFWDGDANDNGEHGEDKVQGNGKIDGGNGVWTSPEATVEANKWTSHNGVNNAPWAQEAFAVFAGEKGIVEVFSDVQNDTEVQPVKVSGMQFLTDGYEIVNGEGEKNTLQAYYTTLIPNVEGGNLSVG